MIACNRFDSLSAVLSPYMVTQHSNNYYLVFNKRIKAIAEHDCTVTASKRFLYSSSSGHRMTIKLQGYFYPLQPDCLQMHVLLTFTAAFAMQFMTMQARSQRACTTPAAMKYGLRQQAVCTDNVQRWGQGGGGGSPCT